MRVRCLSLVGLVSGLALVVSACGEGNGAVIHRGDTVVLVGANGDGDNMAGVGFGGKVAVVGACLGINDATVFWPYGTEVVAENPLTIDVPGLGRVSVGDQVIGGADVYADHLPKGIDAIPSGCPTKDVVAFYPE